MRTVVAFFLIIGAWLLVFVLLAGVLMKAMPMPGRDGPWQAVVVLVFMSALSFASGIAVSRVSRMGHWSGAIIGAIQAGFLLLIGGIRWWVPTGQVAGVVVIFGLVILLPTWCGAWIGGRSRPTLAP